MFVTDSPQALPGTCILCPGSVRERYVDTEIQIEFHGALLLCDLCVIAIGRLLGMMSVEDMAEKDQVIERLMAENFQLLKQTAGLEGAIRGLADAGFQLVPERGDPLVLSADAQGQGDVTEGSVGDTSRSGDSLGAGTGAAPESGDDEQLDRVHADGGGGGTDFRLRP